MLSTIDDGRQLCLVAQARSEAEKKDFSFEAGRWLAAAGCLMPPALESARVTSWSVRSCASSRRLLHVDRAARLARGGGRGFLIITGLALVHDGLLGSGALLLLLLVCLCELQRLLLCFLGALLGLSLCLLELELGLLLILPRNFGLLLCVLLILALADDRLLLAPLCDGPVVFTELREDRLLSSETVQLDDRPDEPGRSWILAVQLHAPSLCSLEAGSVNLALLELEPRAAGHDLGLGGGIAVLSFCS